MKRGAVTFDYGNNIRTVALDAGVPNAFDFPRLRARVRAPALLRGEGAVPLGRALGRPDAICSAPTSSCSSSSRTTSICALDRLAREEVHFQGLPARICWLGQGERAKFGVALNDLVASGELSAPIVIGRDHLDTGSVASPFRETEAMKDGSDAIADWAILNALLNVASGASWVSFHHGGGVGIGNSLHAGQVIVADGTPEMRVRLERVLTNDPGIGVRAPCRRGLREGRGTARAQGIDLPMLRCARLSGALGAFPHPGTCRSSPRSTRGSRARHAPARALRGHDALQRALRLLRLLEDRSSARETELKSFADAARRFNPMMITFTGGEPMLRRDLEELVSSVDRAVG